MVASNTKYRQLLAQLGSNKPTEMVAGGLESAVDRTLDAMPSGREQATDIGRRKSLSDEQIETASRAIDKVVAGNDLSPEEIFSIEAIIIPDKRPAIDILNGDFVVEHPLWVHFSTDPVLHQAICDALPSVGRIELPDHPSLPYGGTGFVVGPNLLMTNRHVAEIFASGLGTNGLIFKAGLSAGIDFLREQPDGAGIVVTVAKVVMIHPYWDMALLQVENLRPEHKPLKLSLRSPEELVDSEVAVIGYPAFDPRNDAAVQNSVFHGVYNVKRLQPGKITPRSLINSFNNRVNALCHDASTLGGNSGSLVLDPRDGKVVALHFAGVYLDRNYGVPTGELARDGRVVDAGLNFEPPGAGGQPSWQEAWRNADARQERSADVPDGQNMKPDNPSSNVPSPLSAGSIARLVVPVEITVRIGDNLDVTVSRPSDHGAITEAMVEPFHDPDYSNRRGYDKGFLGIEAREPIVNEPETVASYLGKPTIPYHHFSLALHKERRIPLFTASNVDGRLVVKSPEPNEKYDRKALGGLGATDMERWFLDPRIDRSYQLPDRFFTKDKGAFDKGHVVRREDVAWGSSFYEVRRANGDTFHVTNCSPQVKGFNQSAQGVDNWGDLENMVMKQANSEKLCVFAGPILRGDDPTFVGVDDDGPVRLRIPRQFWKIVVASSGPDLQSFGFKLEQDLSQTTLEFAVDPPWQKHAISIAGLEELNPLVAFAESIRSADQFGKAPGETLRREAGLPIASKKEVKF
ncbi:hypothetical protein E0H59_18325 [Rhizobium leguminosarum bv. viciae]|uniref:DNA/RNA non-specific endonuclease n=1 Tax=Rhizobium ruizarguesonis TaxID=2081791 RepID=UPI00103C92C7|nr:DNA/RNA non-specific endonuclease [Rhizobium ruizarguesonis]MBY5806089.1 hypothetical protein [Rhizobium leguminosarum]TBY53336.1 hypothetical protein E0H59_18325 [Rhizobium leguminosarum bv. viciae]MBY5846873.1 hypothetical protein [Rhizobium leguminosarum]NEH87946.1 hypothetical protein [Rhizobium ruizarguesonis]NEJ58085.1 hypothetical protein [Rhizobium ruizarguesonis]